MRAIAYPNPFDNSTTIEFSAGYDSHVTLEIYGMTGVKIATLFDAQIEEGVVNKVEFNGRKLADGVYIFKLASDSEVVFDKLMLVK